MPPISSTMLDLGSPAPDFALPDTDGSTVSRSDFTGQPLVVMFICNQCPFVKHVADDLARIAKEYQAKGAAVVAFSPNDADAFPDDGPEKIKEEKARRGYTFPYLYDASQAVAKSYRAACTPDFYLFDREHKLAYRGQLDGSRPDNGIPVTGQDLRAALDAVLAGRPAPADQKPSIGCSIKWMPNNEPAYVTA